MYYILITEFHFWFYQFEFHVHFEKVAWTLPIQTWNCILWIKLFNVMHWDKNREEPQCKLITLKVAFWEHMLRVSKDHKCCVFFFNYYYLLSFHCFFPWRGGWEGGRKWVKPRESKLVENEKGMLSNLCNGRKIDRWNELHCFNLAPTVISHQICHVMKSWSPACGIWGKAKQ